MIFLRSCLLLLILKEICTEDLIVSYNQPKFSCSVPQWNFDGITIKNSSSYQMQSYAMFINSNNSIYTVDIDNQNIFIAKDEEILSILTTDYRMESGLPFSLFVTNDQSIYLTDILVIIKWTPETQIWQAAMYIDDYCFQIFLDLNDTFYCSMFYQHLVVSKWLYETTNQTRIVAGIDTDGSLWNTLNAPCGIFVDTNFDLYVADRDNHRILRFQQGQLDGKIVAGDRKAILDIYLDMPTSIILDAEKYLYIVDSGYHRVVASGKSGFRCLVGCDGRGGASDQLYEPIMISFDIQGDFYITDRRNGRVQKFTQSDSCGNLYLYMRLFSSFF